MGGVLHQEEFSMRIDMLHCIVANCEAAKAKENDNLKHLNPIDVFFLIFS